MEVSVFNIDEAATLHVPSDITNVVKGNLARESAIFFSKYYLKSFGTRDSIVGQRYYQW
jgi:hypothetical protein